YTHFESDEGDKVLAWFRAFGR
ncbi:hypothetical protein A2U01_0109433, partial [Trifolium medium]|nr:hypothetical protein [Trifolium medium]